MKAFPARLRAALVIAPWGYFLRSGYDLCYGLHAAPPSSTQIHLYVIAPAVGTAVGFVLLALAHKTRQWLGWLFFVLQVFALIPVIALWSGGI
jgi:hypothetical protein